jgi:hypothetical protein
LLSVRHASQVWKIVPRRFANFYVAVDVSRLRPAGRVGPKKQNCDVIHLQRCSQYIPVIRAHNPRAKIVLHLHGEWFSQSNPAALTGRIAQVDLLTSVGNHITKKTKLTFPAFADRCETTYNGIDAQEFSRDNAQGLHDRYETLCKPVVNLV